MKVRFYLLFAFFTLLFFTYPGDSGYLHVFSYNRQYFLTAPKKTLNAIQRFDPVPYTVSQETPAVSAQGVLVVDYSTFTPLFVKNLHDRLYPASTTKVMTALVVLDIYNPEDIISVKHTLSEGQTIGLVEGERITVENLLYGMLVESGNDAAYAFADAYGFEKFIARMNKKAESLGMRETHYTNPAGLDDPAQFTTPYDLALASRELLKSKLLKKIVSTKEITVDDADFKYFHKLTNVNKLLGEVQGVGGLKTGFTEAAGENLVSLYKKDGHDLLIIILKSRDRFADTKTVIKWIDDNVRYYFVK